MQHVSATLEPFAWTIAEIMSGLQSGHVCFISRLSVDAEPLGIRHSEVIGYYDEHNVYITKPLTWHWLQTRWRRTGRTTHFTWNALMSGLRNAVGPYLTTTGTGAMVSHIVAIGNGKSARCAVIPRLLLEDANKEVHDAGKDRQDLFV